jgi:MFS transporter, DHA1 family, multidrug resistance protein
LAVLLAALSMIGPFSIDTYLPAFPAIARTFAATDLQVQQTLTAYLAPFAFMMLWHGALSDALGRRRVILWGLALYGAASLVCVFAHRIEMLWLGRALQGLSAGAGMIVGRAIIRDLLDGPAAQRLMAQSAMVFAIAPAIAPVIGGAIHAYFDWHGIFVFLVLVSVALWLAVWKLLPETLPPEKRQDLHPLHLWHAYQAVLSHPRFLLLALTVAFNFAGFFIYVLSAPVFLIRHLGVSPQGFAWMFVPAVTGMICGSWLSGRSAGRISSRRSLAIAYGLMVAAATINLGLNLAIVPGLPWAVLPLGLYSCGMAYAMPVLTLLALDLFPERRGLASSCQGTIQTGLNAIVASLIVPLIWGSLLSLAAGMAGALMLGMAASMLTPAHRKS